MLAAFVAVGLSSGVLVDLAERLFGAKIPVRSRGRWVPLRSFLVLGQSHD
jgi:hypothetical protein